MSTVASPSKAKVKLTIDEIILIVVAISGFFTVYAQVAVLVFVSIFALIKRREMFKDRIPETILLGAFSALAITVTAVYGTWPMILLSVALVFACVDIIYVSRYLTSRSFKIITQVVCFASIPCLGVAHVQKLLGMSWEYGERYCSVFFNANFYGLVAAMTILLCVHRICRKPRPLTFIIYSALIAVNVMAIYLTGSRMPIIVITAGIFAYLVTARKWKTLTILCVLAGILVAVDIACGEAIDIIPRMGDLEESFHGRFAIWKNAWESIKMRPLFGYGTYSYARVFNDIGGWYAIHAHNLILEVLMDYGIVGMGILVAFFARVMYQGSKAIKTKRDRLIQGIVVATYVITLLSGMFDLAMFWPQTAVILCFGMSSGRTLIKDTGNSN